MSMSGAEAQKAFYENQARQESIVDSLYVTPSGTPEERARLEAKLKEELTPFQLNQMIEKVAAQKQREVEKQAAKSPEQKESERLQGVIAEGKKQAPTYRESYDAGEPTSFEEAKQAADETYMQYWYDEANAISSKWTDKDYQLIAEPTMESYRDKYGRTQERRVLPEGYDEFVAAQQRIDAGVLDFSSEETHKMLIKPPPLAGGRYAKEQEWIDEDNPLRQAVEAQADVMKDFLDAEGISIVRTYEDVGMHRPDELRGEGLYLNTGTGAHIDWNSDLKRMQRYQSTPNGELGTYSQIFVRPDPEGLAPIGQVLTMIGALSGNPLLRNIGAVAQGGDLEDIAKNVIAANIAPDILENTLGDLGVDADLFGLDNAVFSEGITEVQTAIITGDSVTDAIGSAFGGELLDAVTPAIEGVLPDIDVPEAFEKAGDILASTIKPAVDTLEEVFEPVVNVIEDTANVIEQTAEPITNVVETVAQPVINTIEKAASTVEKAVEPIVDVAEVAVDKTVDVSVDVINALRASVGLPPFGETVENFDANNDGIVTSADAQQVMKDEQPEPVVEPEVSPVEPEVPPVEPEVTDISLAEKTFNSFGLTGDSFGISNAEFSDAMNKVEKAMLEGKSGQEALVKELGVETLSKLGSEAGGMFMQAINTLDPIVDAFGNVIKPVVQTVGNVIEPVVKPVVDVVETVAKPVVDVVEPVVQTVGDVGQAVVDVAEPVVTTVGDVVETVAKPVVETVEQTAPIVEDIFIDPIKEGVETVVDIGSDVLSEAEDVFIDPVKEGLEAVVEAVPEVDVTLPEINVPSFDLPSMLGMLGTTQRQPTQVENLFDKELFKFDTEIKSTQQMLSPMMNLRRYG